jgi:hypothetical protein
MSETKKRYVVVTLSIPVVLSYPDDSYWNKEGIEFHLNEGSNCVDNQIRDFIQQFEHRNDKDCYCFDPETKATYVREATDEDILRTGIRK